MMAISNVDYIGIGRFIKERRKVLGLSQEELSEIMNISTELLTCWENEDLDYVGIHEMKTLSKVLSYCPLIFIKGVPEDAYRDWDSFIHQEYIKSK